MRIAAFHPRMMLRFLAMAMGPLDLMVLALLGPLPNWAWPCALTAFRATVEAISPSDLELYEPVLDANKLLPFLQHLQDSLQRPEQ